MNVELVLNKFASWQCEACHVAGMRDMQTARRAEVSPDRPSTSSVATKAAVRIAGAWGLTTAQAATLLDVGQRTFARMKSGEHAGELSQDQLMRASALVGLYKGLHLYFSDELADRWPCMPNKGDLFAGRSPLDHMQAGGLPALIETRAYVDAIRGGM